MSIHPLHRRPSRPTIEEDLDAMRRDLEEVAAGLADNSAALTSLETAVAEVKAGTNEILAILRGGAR